MKKATFIWCALLGIVFLACQLPDNSFARTAFSLQGTVRRQVIVAPLNITGGSQHTNGNKVSSFYFKRPLQVKSKMMQLLKEHCNCIANSRLFAAGNICIRFSSIFIR